MSTPHEQPEPQATPDEVTSLAHVYCEQDGLTYTNGTMAAADDLEAIDPMADLQELTAELTAIESRLQPLQEERTHVREKIKRIVAYFGGKAILPNFGKLEVLQDTVVATYDRAKVDAVVARLVQIGDYHTADQLTAARKETIRPATLRIVRSKPEVQ